MPEYRYRANVLNVVDGDTIDVDIDLGLDVWHRTRLRLFGINTPELHSKDPVERQRAQAARQFVVDTVQGQAVEVLTIKDRTEKYGRYLANVILPDGLTLLNQLLLEKQLAVPYVP